MFNPHIHQQQQQQQQQFHQHLRQLQQLFQQQPPPPPPPQPPPGHHVAHHHHQNQRALTVPSQTANPQRMVNLCQATQTNLLAPNPMLQGALLMQQMQGNMRGYGMGGQQFHQFFAAGARSSLLGPVPMGMAMKSPMMGYPAARSFHPHARYYNNNSNTATITTAAPSTASSSSSSITTDIIARQPDRKQDGEQIAAGSTEAEPAASSTSDAHDKSETDGEVGEVDGATQILDEELDGPAAKKPRTEEPETIVSDADADAELLSSENNSNTENQNEDCVILEEGCSTGESDVVEMVESRADEVKTCLSAPSPSGGLNEDDQQVNLPSEEMSQGKDESLCSPGNLDEGEEGVADSTNKFYCYLCSITCHSQQNFRSHMNSVNHQQRMMEIQHMSNACLVTLLPRVQESLQGAVQDGEKKADLKRWCATCHTHFTTDVTDHRRTEEHKLASRTAISSCMVCKKHFGNAQIFVEHLQSQEHKHKMEKLQEKDGCEGLAKLTAMDTEGFSLEGEQNSEVEEEEERQRNEEDPDSSEKQDDWSSPKEVTLKNMASEEQYDPDTVYGSSFFVPVAGFICRLCNKFYHFESSALHTHCKSLTHFENLKRSRSLLSKKEEAVRERLLAADSLRPVKENTTDLSEENSLSDDTGSVTNSTQPKITLTETENQQNENEPEPDPTSNDTITTSATCAGSTDEDLPLHSQEEESSAQASVLQESPAELSAESREEPDSMQAAVAEDVKEEEQLEMEAPAVPGKKNGTAKGKTAAKRRSGRANRR
ncbi:cdkn1a interacting zinc finger protein 1a [Limanda limanda]|uniref:cdkn1a interacting zinc finger protein 1a n=1 Tax=Limanda limanda TaxID=27771 RepID=UPI0029C6F5F0|nr:cdkn1a interacting zinc finger protein 1a [Limanda limanda]XP_060937868.1 cdkn1a interacting zinc finger protein 1a [Limanda limanda]XP_060937874.1 cdkn1a interacting zinc finger protein 1a [Limanda limanda]